jgi:hypothetical protein
VSARGLAPVARGARLPLGSGGSVGGPVGSAPAPAAPPPSGDRTNTTQFLSEEDLIPPSAAPPPVPRDSGKHAAIPALPTGTPPSEKKS